MAGVSEAKTPTYYFNWLGVKVVIAQVDA